MDIITHRFQKVNIANTLFMKKSLFLQKTPTRFAVFTKSVPFVTEKKFLKNLYLFYLLFPPKMIKYTCKSVGDNRQKTAHHFPPYHIQVIALDSQDSKAIIFSFIFRPRVLFRKTPFLCPAKNCLQSARFARKVFVLAK